MWKLLCFFFFCAALRIENFFTLQPRELWREKARWWKRDEIGLQHEKGNFFFFMCWLNFTFWKVNFGLNHQRALKNLKACTLLGGIKAILGIIGWSGKSIKSLGNIFFAHLQMHNECTFSSPITKHFLFPPTSSLCFSSWISKNP